MDGPNDRLVGRFGELDQLFKALSNVARGEGCAYLLVGEAGVGKTRLVQEVIGEARSLGFQVLSGACEELEQRRPFAAIADCLGIQPGVADSRRSALARLLAEDLSSYSDPGPLPEAPLLEFRVVEAFVGLIEDLCAEAPLLVALDDLQWADASTILVLNRLSRYLSSLPVLLTCSRRPVPDSKLLEQLTNSLVKRGAVQLAIKPLDRSAVASLLESLLGREPGPKLVKLAEASGGNPLFLTELIGALQLDNAIELTADGKADTDLPNLPPSLAPTILHRLSFLSVETVEVLRLGSVLGSSFEVADLCVVLDRSAASLMTIFREAMAAGILQEDEERLSFRHELIREALYEDLPAAVRRRMHRDAAQALARGGAKTEKVAEQAARGATAGDTFALEWLQRASEEAATRAPAIAVEWLDKAIQLVGSGPGSEPLLAEKAVVLLWAGRVLEAESICRRLLPVLGETSLRGRVQLCLTQALFARGRDDEAVRVAEEAVHNRGLPDVERAQIRAWAALSRLAMGDLPGAIAGANEAKSAGSADGLTGAVSLTVLATAENFEGRFRDAVQMQDQAIRLADQTPMRVPHRFPLCFFQGIFLTDIDELTDADIVLQRGRQISEELGARWNLPLYAWASALVRFLSGDWDDALTGCEACLQLADELGTHHGVLIAHALNSLIALHRGELESARSALSAADREFDATGPQYGLENLVAWARALLLEAEGDPRAGASVLGDAWDSLIDADIVSYRFELGPDLVRLAMKTHDPNRAEAVTSAVERLAELNSTVDRAVGCALRCRGALDGCPETLVKATVRLRAANRPLETALACEDAGAALGNAGRLSEARPLFDESARIYENLGAAHDLARAEARMRSVGLRRGSRAPRRRPATGLGSLTPTELAVAQLVATGLSNPAIASRLFVSRHTIHTHVAHILTKLGLASRVQLAAQWAPGGPKRDLTVKGTARGIATPQ